MTVLVALGWVCQNVWNRNLHLGSVSENIWIFTSACCLIYSSPVVTLDPSAPNRVHVFEKRHSADGEGTQAFSLTEVSIKILTTFIPLVSQIGFFFGFWVRTATICVFHNSYVTWFWVFTAALNTHAHTRAHTKENPQFSILFWETQHSLPLCR